MNTEILLSDNEVWKSLPKLRWVYNTTNILDIQKVEWSPSEVPNSVALPTFSFSDNNTLDDHLKNSGYIFVPPLGEEHIIIDTVISKGDIKWQQYRSYDKCVMNQEVLDHINGEIKLKIDAFIRLNFNKFYGFINFETIGKTIVAIRLKPAKDVMQNFYPPNWNDNLIRVLNKKAWKD